MVLFRYRISNKPFKASLKKHFAKFFSNYIKEYTPLFIIKCIKNEKK